ncbi:hypothetical protein [Lichenicoccus sp.]|uniref:hypothetical protein n=1 Tax=Lichenicoccus sp. TaxID=2781899 RepID=UPI003D14551F
MIATYTAIVSALVPCIGLLIGFYSSWLRTRESALRREDVLEWSKDVIKDLQTLCLLCYLDEANLPPERRHIKLEQVIFSTSVLVEQGRLLFKNRTDNDYGREKIGAYQGFRPRILDQIVMAHQIAVLWNGAGSDERLRMRLVAEDCLKHFVSLAQLEVGRGRTAVSGTNEPGRGKALDYHLQVLDGKRIEGARSRMQF